MAAESTSNIREYSVSELSGAIRRAMEEGFPLVRVRGELSGVKRHSNGHIYLDLKDENASIAGVIWRSTALRLRVAPEPGMEVVATGRVSTFGPQSKYQLVIDSLEPAGAGALMAVLDERRKRLAAEGLFAESRKKPIPFLPEVIGVVTSPSGAVIRDILHRLRERCPARVILWPTAVQGKGADLQIAAAIAGFNGLAAGGEIPRPDVLIVARGGGSLEDLWCFNEESVVRAVASSAIPVISAIGHETDTTLIDFAADLRAPTPSAAAEKAVPMRSELLAEVLNKHRRMIAAEIRRLDERRLRVAAAARGLGRPEDATGVLGQRLDRNSDRLAAALRARSDAAAARFARLGGRLGKGSIALGIERKRLTLNGLSARMSPDRLRASLADRRAALHRDGARFASVGLRLLRRQEERLAAASKLLRSVSYRSVLDRGFALVRTAGGALARRAADLPAHGAATLVFSDGERTAHLGDPPKRPPPAKKADQKSLFD